MKVLAYVRPWAADYFYFVAKNAFSLGQVQLLSDFRGLGEFDLSERFTQKMSRARFGLARPPWISPADEFDIIARNYVLRSMSFERARRFVTCMAWAIQECIDKAAPQRIITMSGDNYVLDLLGRYSAITGRPIWGMIPCPLRGYTRVTMRGEYTAFRAVNDEEATLALQSITDPAFRPLDMLDWLSMYGSYVTLTRALREKPKQWIFPIVGRLKRDPYNYHYVGSALSRVSFISQGLFIDRYFDEHWERRAREHNGIRVYLPLPAYPEATTDYHVAQLELIEFHAILFRVLKQYAGRQEFLILVKEHPGMMGARPPGFYSELRALGNVVLVGGTVPSLDVIDFSDVVVTWTGTGGLEAITRRKPVVTLGRPYYSSGPAFDELLRNEDLVTLPIVTQRAAESIVQEQTPLEVVRSVLQSCIPGEFRQLGFKERGAAGEREALHLARNIAHYWEPWSEIFPAAFHAHLKGDPTAPGPEQLHRFRNVGSKATTDS